MSSPVNRRSAGSRRRPPAPVSSRDPYGNASLSSSNSGSCKGSDCSPTKRNVKYTSCTDNHGIRPPPPEQYLTPLQQKEVCIRHLRARLKDTVDRLQDRDSEIDELRTQLSRMQEDWIEEECHRVEAQLSLKEAQGEIQELKQVIDVVRSSLGSSTDTGMQKCFQDINLQNHKLETLLHSMELAQTGAVHKQQQQQQQQQGEARGGEGPAVVPAELEVGEGPAGGSCEGSLARSLTRSSTYTKLSDQAPGERSSCGSTCGSVHGAGGDFPCLSAEGTQDSGFMCCGESADSHTDLLMEAAFLSKETASLLSSYSQLPHSSTFERLAPRHCGVGTSGSASHPCLSHHHLYLHHLREQGIQTDCAPASAPAHGYGPLASDLDTIAEQRTFRSQACSPTSTWLSDEGDDLDSITTVSVTTTTMTATTTAPEAGSVLLPIDPPEPPLHMDPPDPPLPSPASASSSAILPLQVDASNILHEHDLNAPPPQTSQPRSAGSPVPSGEPLVVGGVTVVEVDEDEESIAEEDEEAAGELGDASSGPVVKSYWSRHFLVDLLAVAVPVVPTVAWLCRAPRGDGQPLYHFGSLLRGCCTVALHSLRRGGGVRHYPAGGGGVPGAQI
ncbi:syntaphilin isoform X2 [Clupea harengus]|uniref:Syntaphilin isoform X2 n=1 Tax=Clupea harengus TaxID=7950 RepID=A0A6P8FE70_CLUHA|nr:syntaphilin isoform X2 [Clupea harengus]